MSTIYDKTDNYALSLYGDDDPADLRDGYNNSMNTIDAALETHLSRIEGVEARETHDEEVVKTLIGDNTVDNATTAKNKWDKAGTDATAANDKADSNTTILAALGADNPTDAAMLRDKIIDPRNILVVFGDSMTTAPDIDGQRYPEKLAQKLGLILKNYGHGGSGFLNVSNGVSYGTEIDNARKDASYDKTKVRYVLINGSTNDMFTSADAITAKVESLTNEIKKLYPSSTIYGLTGLFFNNVRNVSNGKESEYRVQNYTKTVSATKVGFANAGVNVIDSDKWFAYAQGLDMGDHLHPSAQGAEILANTLTTILVNHANVLNTQVVPQVSNKELFALGENKRALSEVFKAYSVEYSNVLVRHDMFLHTFSVSLGLNHDDLLKFAYHKSDDGTKVWSVDVPIFVKTLPYRRTQTSENNNIPAYATIRGCNLLGAFIDVYRTVDSRLDTPTDAAKYGWLHFDFCPDPDAYKTGANAGGAYNLLDGTSSSDVDKTLTLTVRQTISLPLDATFNS
jgi:lysophospholipase L1-like esterase